MTTLYYSSTYSSYFIIVDGHKHSTSQDITSAFLGKTLGPISTKVFELMTAYRKILFQHETSDPVEAYFIFKQQFPEYFI